MSINIERLKNLSKVGFYEKFNDIKKAYSNEIENYTTRFRLSWRELSSKKTITGRYTIKQFLHRYIMLSVNSSIEEQNLIIIVDENIEVPADKRIIKKLGIECIILCEFMELFNLYQINISESLSQKNVVIKFMGAMDWLTSSILEKKLYKDKYFKTLVGKTFEKDENYEKNIKIFIEHSKNINLYPTKHSNFMHQCILYTHKMYTKTLEHINKEIRKRNSQKT